MDTIRRFTDQMGRQVAIPFPPQRIVSLVPSQTELLYELGLDDRVAGITRFCVHPKSWFRSKTRVGGTKQVHLDRIEALNPDLIIGNKEENERLQIEALAERYPVWMSDVRHLAGALEMIEQTGRITGCEASAAGIAGRIRTAFEGLAGTIAHRPFRRAAYLIWRNPWMAVGGDTFIHEMMTLGGMDNVFGHMARYPEVSLAQLAEAQAELVLLSSEPYPFKEKYFEEIRPYCPDARILLVDGELFSWYGSRLLHTPTYLRQLANEHAF